MNLQTNLALLGLLVMGSGQASVQAQQNDENIETVKVTGLRTVLDKDRIPNSVTVIGRDQLEARQSFQLVDILRDVAGLTVARSGGFGAQAQLRMRGAEANQILVLIDGVAVNDPASADEFLLEHMSVAGIERVEIIRGPQSALWGSDAVAGVINIVTTSGRGAQEISGMVEGGSFGSLRAMARARTGGNTWRLDMSAAYGDSKGANTSRLGGEKDGYENLTVQAGIVADLLPNLEVDIGIRHVAASNEFDPFDFFTTGLPTDGDNLSKVKRTTARARLKLDLMGGRWSSRAGFEYLDTSNRNFAGGLTDGATLAERWKVFAQSSFAPMDGHLLTVAIDYQDTDFHQLGLASFFGDPNQDQSISLTGLIADYVGDLMPGLTLSASVRRDDNSDFDDVTTWRAGFTFAASDTIHLRASAGKGQKAPTFTERFGFFADQFVGNPDLKPETSVGYEAGLDVDFAEGRGRFEATWFQSRLKSEIDGFVFDLDTFLFTAENLDGISRRRGVELSAALDAGGGFNLSGNYTYTRSNQPDGFGARVAELRRPRHSVSAGLDYVHGNGIRLNINLAYTGAARDLFFPPFPTPSEIVTLKSYLLASVSAEWPLIEGVKLFGRVENAFDENYEDVFGFNTPGIGAYAGVRAAF